MGKRIAIFIIIFFALSPIIITILDEIEWSSFEEVKITSIDYTAVIVDEPGSYGKIRVTERLTFDIQALSQYYSIWELWRALPEDVIDGVEIFYNVLSVKQVFDDGRAPVVFTEAPQLYWFDNDYTGETAGLGPGKWFHSEGPYDGRYNFECILIYVDGLYRETVVFEIEYEMYNAVLRYYDCSQLHIALYSDEAVNNLERFSAQFLIPDAIMPRAGNFEVSTYGANSRGFPVFESSLS